MGVFQRSLSKTIFLRGYSPARIRQVGLTPPRMIPYLIEEAGGVSRIPNFLDRLHPSGRKQNPGKRDPGKRWPVYGLQPEASSSPGS